MADQASSWRPHPGPQERFLRSSAYECLYGGAAGGGKSDALLVTATLYADTPGYQALLLRRTYPELRMSLMQRSHELLAGWAAWNESRLTWTWESGAILQFGHLENERDVYRYQSAAFAYLGFDELTSFSQWQYEYLLSRCRNIVGLPNRVRSATNPGGIGHGWVKRRFVDAIPSGQKRWYLGTTQVPSGTEGAVSRQWIPARLTDNPTLMAGDPGYIERLRQLPERDRLMLLEGRWDIAFEGLVYDNFDTTVHVVDSFPIPAAWPRFRAVDFGYNNPFVCLWGALSPDDELYIYREVYETERLVSELGPEIRKLSEGERIVATVADHDAENRAELNKHGISTLAARKEIEEGVQEVRRRLEPDARGKARLYLMRGCTVRRCPRLAVRNKPTSTHEEFGIYQYPRMAGDKAAREEPVDLDNHGMDALRYLCMYLRHRRGHEMRWRQVEGI